MTRNRLSSEVIFKLQHPKNRYIKPLLMMALKRNSVSINKYIADNEWNGELTKEAALAVIEQSLKMARTEILEKEPVIE